MLYLYATPIPILVLFQRVSWPVRLQPAKHWDVNNLLKQHITSRVDSRITKPKYFLVRVIGCQWLSGIIIQSVFVPCFCTAHRYIRPMFTKTLWLWNEMTYGHKVRGGVPLCVHLTWYRFCPGWSGIHRIFHNSSWSQIETLQSVGNAKCLTANIRVIFY